MGLLDKSMVFASRISPFYDWTLGWLPEIFQNPLSKILFFSPTDASLHSAILQLIACFIAICIHGDQIFSALGDFSEANLHENWSHFAIIYLLVDGIIRCFHGFAAQTAMGLLILEIPIRLILWLISPITRLIFRN